MKQDVKLIGDTLNLADASCFLCFFRRIKRLRLRFFGLVFRLD
jgi:hypothetical protein